MTIFRFGDFTLAPSERLLLRAGQPVALTGKVFDLLVVLVRSKGRLVGKDELLREVWPGLVVEEVNLSVNVSALRKALAEAPDGNGWIETVPKRGYRFSAPVEVGEAALAQLVQPRVFERWPGFTSRRAWLIGLLTVVVIGAALAWRARIEPDARAFGSVAVLPFVTDNVEEDFIADGLTESVINSLSLLHSLRVTPRATAFRYKRTDVDPRRAGRELGADAVVTGRLAQRDHSLSIQVDLVDVARGSQVWGSSYKGHAAELTHLRTRIAQDIARELNLALKPEEQRSLAQRATDNADAYRTYLQARYFWNQRSESGLKRAVEGFHRAIELDPQFAVAYSGLSDSYTTLGYLSYVAPNDAFPLAKRYALKALELDSSLAEAHASLGYVKFYFDWDWASADAEFLQAITLNPRYPITHQWYSVFLLATGRPREGMREIQIAQEYDPLSLPISTDVGFHYYYNRQYDQAIKQLRNVVEMRSDFALAHLWLGRSLQQVGRYEDALAEFTQAERVLQEWPVLLAARGFVDGASGRTIEARAVLSEMESLSKRKFVTSYGVALVYAGVGENDAAFTWLEKAFDERSHWLVWLRLDPRWDNLRSDPRFSVLVSRMNFPT